MSKVRKTLGSFAVVAALAMLAGVTAAATRDASDVTSRVITVCPSGPPDCDYATIQEGIDAAADGDTVLVTPGLYTGRLTLKSHLTLQSETGPDATTISAADGPIITATHVLSTVVGGFSISGQGAMTEALGIDLADSELNLLGCAIGNVQGQDGTAASPVGRPALAIRATGTSVLTVTGSTIEDIHGGAGYSWSDGRGGDATGISMSGSGRLEIAATAVRSVVGGDSGANLDECGPEHAGGTARAVVTDGQIDLDVSESEITDLEGGYPCIGLYGCPWYAGAVLGLDARGGTVELRDSLFSRLDSWDSNDFAPSFGVRTRLTGGTVLERNVISDMTGPAQEGRLSPAGDVESPFCMPVSSITFGVSSENDARLVLIDNLVTNLSEPGWHGQVYGVSAQGVAEVSLAGNSATGLDGGSDGVTSAGFRLEAVGSALIDSNTVHQIRGGEIPVIFYYAFSGVAGGDAVGIDLASVTTATVTNNDVWSVTGGNATRGAWQPKDGGDATALLVSGGSARIVNNDFRETAGGVAAGNGEDGRAVGLEVADAAEATVANNLLTSHDIGIWSELSPTPLLAHNDFWANDADYQGVAPGEGDLHVDPSFCDGWIHLCADSPLIDAGTNAGIPGVDVDGDMRPMDGDGDGIAVADIGADEYWPGMRGSGKGVDKASADAGDVLTYEIVLKNPSESYDLPDVHLVDPIPGRTAYVPGSVWASDGSCGYADGVITWTGRVDVGVAVTLTFQVTVDAGAGGHLVANRAVVDDGTGKTYLQAITVVPSRQYLPLVAGNGP